MRLKFATSDRRWIQYRGAGDQSRPAASADRLRSPLLENQAVIACVENPFEIFSGGKPPRISATLQTLGPRGDGIRGMSYMPALDGYLVISGPVAFERVHFQLWFWSGQRDFAGPPCHCSRRARLRTRRRCQSSGDRRSTANYHCQR